MVPLGGFCRYCQMQVAVSLKLYVYRPRTAVTQVQISLGCSRKREKYGDYVCPVEWMSYDFVFVMEVSFPCRSFSLCSLIHGSVWVKMHNEFIKGDWRNQERCWLHYWIRARWSVLPEISSRTLSTLLTNLIKCTKCYTLTSPSGAIMAVKIERSPPGGILLTGKRLPVSVSWLHWLYWFVTAFRVISSAKVRATCWPGDFFLFILYLFRSRTLLPSD